MAVPLAGEVSGARTRLRRVPNRPSRRGRPEVLLELLKLKGEEAHHFVTTIVRTIALYLAITGVLLKFALDVNSTAELRATLSLMGIANCSLLLLACYVGEKHRVWLRDELNDLRAALLRDAPQERLMGVLNLIIGAFALALASLLGWVAVAGS